MDLFSQEGEIPIPIPIINTSYGDGEHGNMIHHDPAHHHNHIIASSASQMNPSSSSSTQAGMEEHQHGPKKKVVRYRECLKNHAAAMGGNATDGCGEFMPSGEGGTIEVLSCSVCRCHRNFHQKEIEGEPYSSHFNRLGRKFIVGHHKNIIAPEALVGCPTATGNILPSRTVLVPPHQVIMPYNMRSLPSESDEQEESGPGGSGHPHPQPQIVKKRFRTKFTQEQKERMLHFADKVGWKIQKQEESVVQQLCQEIGVKRRVLKVWMHNNKYNLAKKNPPTA